MLEDVLDREQFSLELIKTAYNTLKLAGNTFGFHHSEEAKEKIRKAMKGNINNLSRY